MRIAALIVLVALAEGCANAALGVSAGGTSTTSAASLNTNSDAAALGLVLIFGTIDYVNNPQPMPSPSSLFMFSPPAPELSPSRRISEQDCSKPVDLTLGNLRCK